jgi:hypothetical protein
MELHTLPRLHLKFKHIPRRIEEAGEKVMLSLKRYVSPVHLRFCFCFWRQDRMLIKK